MKINFREIKNLKNSKRKLTESLKKESVFTNGNEEKNGRKMRTLKKINKSWSKSIQEILMKLRKSQGILICKYFMNEYGIIC